MEANETTVDHPSRYQAASWLALFAALGPAVGWGCQQAFADLGRSDLRFSGLLVAVAAAGAAVIYSGLTLTGLLSLLATARGPGTAERFAAHLAPVGWQRTVLVAFGCAATLVPATGASIADGEHSPGSLSGLPLPDRPVGGAGAPVVVRPGDSLWLIAARDLGRGATDRRIAQRWPQWYHANRRVIGVDPGQIFPGTLLHSPRRASEGMR